MRDGNRSGGRPLLNGTPGRAEVRDDLLLDYLLGRLSPGAHAAMAERMAVDPVVAARVSRLSEALAALQARAAEAIPTDTPADLVPLLNEVAQLWSKR